MGAMRAHAAYTRPLVAITKKRKTMESIKKWFKDFKESNVNIESLISQIESNISETGFNESKFNRDIEKNIKSIEAEIIKEKFQPKSDENKENND